MEKLHVAGVVVEGGGEVIGRSVVVAGAWRAAYRVVGGDDRTLTAGGVIDDEVAGPGSGEEVVLVMNLRIIPVRGVPVSLTLVTGACSLALTASGGVITDERGLFSRIARISGERDSSSGV